VVSAALALLDEVGLDGLSMRRLADRLHIKAASLYWYVQDKEELLGLLADAICCEVRAPDKDTPWRAQLESLLWEYRRVLLAHRDSGRILAGTIPVGPNRLRLVDMTLGALLTAGLDGLSAARAGRLLVDYATAFVMEEINEITHQSGMMGQETGDEDVLEDERPSFITVSAEVFPSIAALANHLADSDNDARFRFGIKVVLDGLERQLAEQRGYLK
jgi:TetR/AcrR family tetracycline transcriptional repressor